MNKSFKTLVAIFTLVTAIFAMDTAFGADQIGEAQAKGMFFKDSLKTLAFDDPTISGVSCYTTRYSKSFSLVDSTNSSLSCRQVGPIKGTLADRTNVFSQQKGFLFSKKTVTDRYFDAKRKVLVYLSYTKSMGSKNSSHSLSVVPIKPWK